MFRHGCTTINFNWILTRQRWFSSLLNTSFSADLNVISIHLSSTVRNLGVTLDQNLSFQQHVSRTCQICYSDLRRINSICHYLSQDALKTLISAFVLSRIDYCNSLLAGCPKQLIHKLQKVQNNAARLICRTPYVWSYISRPLHSSLASCWTKNWIQTASPCLQICKQQWSVISVWPLEVLHSFSTASVFLRHPSPSHFFIPSEILWTTQIFVLGLCSMELSTDLTPSFQLCLCLQI